MLRIRFEKAGLGGLAVPVERYFPAETYPEAQEALLHHFEHVPVSRIEATPGYFVPVRAPLQAPVSTVA